MTLSSPARIGAHMSTAGGLHKAVARALDLHMTAVQIFTKNNRQWQAPPLAPDAIARWKGDFAESGIQNAVSHASYLINLASPKADIWAKSRAAIRDELERAHRLGIPAVVLHPGAHVGSGPEAGIQRIAQAVNETYRAHPHLADVQLLFEVMAGQGTVIGGTLEELAQLLHATAEQAHTGICLDTCHLFAAGYELRSPEAYETLIETCRQTVGLEAIRCWHLNDSQGALRSHRDRHQHLGEGELGRSPFGYVLNDPRWYDRPLLLETPKTVERESDLKNMQVLGALLRDKTRIPAGLMQDGALNMC